MRLGIDRFEETRAYLLAEGMRPQLEGVKGRLGGESG